MLWRLPHQNTHNNIRVCEKNKIIYVKTRSSSIRPFKCCVTKSYRIVFAIPSPCFYTRGIFSYTPVLFSSRNYHRFTRPCLHGKRLHGIGRSFDLICYKLFYRYYLGIVFNLNGLRVSSCNRLCISLTYRQ